VQRQLDADNGHGIMALPLLTFAVIEEARPLQRLVRAQSDVKVLLTGIGRRNAEQMIREALAGQRFQFVLTCGFAGGLNPELPTGTVVFSADEGFSRSPALLAAGAQPARFHCADRIATSAEEKRRLWQSTGADAVEMESAVIRTACREHGIPSATVRVISDNANEDLPLDFNRLMDAEQNVSYARLALALASSPGKIGALLRLQRETKAAAERLADALVKVIAGRAPARP
jgi:nucleoside phosphorylase